MLKELEYSVTFPTTGRTLAQKINFQTGFGAVIGPNEAGKSFIIEMIRWLMFGSKALRGKADDYKTLRGALKLAIRGVDYTIERTVNNAKVFRDGEQIAVGTRPVNDKIAQLLGYGLSVFDTAHIANQGDIEKLGAMLPAERKRMVDSVIGLGVIEDLAKTAGSEATALKRRAEDLRASVNEPIAVIEPEGYRPSAEIQREVQDLTALRSEYDQLLGWLKTQQKEPVLPTTTVQQSVEELTALADEQRDLETQRLAVKQNLATLPERSKYSEADLLRIEGEITAYNAYQAQQSFLALNPRPTHQGFELLEMRQEHVTWAAYQDRQRLQKQLDQLLAQGHHCCPSCSHQWPVASEAIESLQEQLSVYPAVVGELQAPSTPLGVIEKAERQLANWEKVADQWSVLSNAVEVAKPELTVQGVVAERTANQMACRREELEAVLADLDSKLDNTPNYPKLLLARQAFELELVRYEEALKTFKEWQVARAAKEARVRDLEEAVGRLPELSVQLEQSRKYEAAKATFDTLTERYNTVVEAAKGFAVEAEDWDKAKEALTNLRGLVKQHLVPSLNLVASHLLRQMTGGARQQVVVDEDFNVLVDGQALNTLSGSGKAVANLALRLGLGQVLTNNVFSLFVGDEIDASMDKDRAENTANTLQTLKQRISQILLVTHKYPVADYYVELGTTNEQTALE